LSQQSGFWTTDAATPEGHQVASYTQAIAAKAWAIMAACDGFEGVSPSYLNALVGSVPAANTARIGTGGAIVDGQWYENGAAVDVNIPSAVGGGNTRIDRIVLRVSWASFQCVITRIAGTDAGSPAVPSITQTPGTTYDIMLYQALVNTSGTVTLTDERVLSTPIAHRQGGSATNWQTNGTTNYLIGSAYLIQCGSAVSAADGTVTVTYPVAYADHPIVLANVSELNSSAFATLANITENNCVIHVHNHDGGDAIARVNWLAIGPK
jgi:hypothetical protein